MKSTIQKEYASQFGGLWIDKFDYEEQLSKRVEFGNISAEEKEQLEFFVKNGYLIIRNAVDVEVVEALKKEVENTRELSQYYLTRNNEEGYRYAKQNFHSSEKFRYIDFHVNSLNAKKLVFADKISKFLALIFEESPLAFQTLLFRYGSQQAIHQDTAYVVADEPMKLAASWIALEDVKQGTGELVYYPGSHKHKEYLFSGEHKSWMKARDGVEQHQDFLKHLHVEAEQNEKEIERFLPKKGDALIWHADLAHGGAKITQPGKTRLSLVTHYCPASCRPNYSNYIGYYQPVEFEDKGFYSSRHYDLSASTFGLKQPTFMGSSVDKMNWELNEETAKGIQKRNNTELDFSKNTLKVIAANHDPGFEIFTDLEDPVTKVKIELEINAEKDTVFQVFFKHERGTTYAEKGSKQVKMKAGKNKLTIQKELNKSLYSLRIDPAKHSGQYDISNMKVKVLI